MKERNRMQYAFTLSSRRSLCLFEAYFFSRQTQAACFSRHLKPTFLGPAQTQTTIRSRQRIKAVWKKKVQSYLVLGKASTCSNRMIANSSATALTRPRRRMLPPANLTRSRSRRTLITLQPVTMATRRNVSKHPFYRYQ